MAMSVGDDWPGFLTNRSRLREISQPDTRAASDPSTGSAGAPQ